MSLNLCYTFTHGATSIPYGESIDDYQLGNSTATRVLFTSWANALTFQDRALEYSTFTYSAGAWSLTFQLGWPHPHNSRLYVKDCVITPVGKPTGAVATWPYAKHELRYERVDLDLSTGGSGVRRIDRIETISEVVNVPREKIVPVGTGKKVMTNLPAIMHIKQYSVTFLRVRNIPLNAITALENRVNAAPFTLRVNNSTETYPAGHVLFQGASIDTRNRQVTESGTYSDLTMTFLCRDRDWRHVFDPRSTGASIQDCYELIGFNLYDTGDFAALGV
jgi:hypothetical protein